MVIRDVCPRCQSPKFKKNGHIHNGKQNHHCHDCGRQFVQCCEQYLISDDKRGLIERLLMERISLRGICRAVGVTLKWLLGFLVQCFAALPDHLHVQPVSCQHDVLIQRLEVEADELASFVQKPRFRTMHVSLSNFWLPLQSLCQGGDYATLVSPYHPTQATTIPHTSFRSLGAGRGHV